MIVNLVAIFVVQKIKEGFSFYVNESFFFFLKIINKSENKIIRQNGLRVLTYFCERLNAEFNSKKLVDKATKFLASFVKFWKKLTNSTGNKN